MTALEKIKDMIDFCDAIGCHRALYESLKAVEAELEALQQRSCEGCKYGKYGADSRGIEVECTLIWHCARGNGFPDRYEPKEQ